MDLSILYEDERFVIVNKPHGLLVHRSPIAKDATEFLVQKIRDQFNKRVHPVHRLDRKTSGAILLAFDKEANSKAQQLFSCRAVKKEYLAIIRGYTDDLGLIDYPLISEKGIVQACLTAYKTLDRVELPVKTTQHKTGRYSLVLVSPKTGRMHQIRKHFSHIMHPIIGDRPHGCNKQNKLFKEHWQMTSMLLHAWKLEFQHPFTNQEIKVEAPVQEEFQKMLDMMSFKLP